MLLYRFLLDLQTNDGGYPINKKQWPSICDWIELEIVLPLKHYSLTVGNNPLNWILSAKLIFIHQQMIAIVTRANYMAFIQFDYQNKKRGIVDPEIINSIQSQQSTESERKNKSGTRKKQ